MYPRLGKITAPHLNKTQTFKRKCENESIKWKHIGWFHMFYFHIIAPGILCTWLMYMCSVCVCTFSALMWPSWIQSAWCCREMRTVKNCTCSCNSSQQFPLGRNRFLDIYFTLFFWVYLWKGRHISYNLMAMISRTPSAFFGILPFCVLSSFGIG